MNPAPPLVQGAVLRKHGFLEPLYGAPSLRAFYAERANRNAVIELVRQLHARQPVQVLSLDVFDTALLRESKSEAERFLEMARSFTEQCRRKRLRRKFSVEDALVARALAARSAYAIAPLRHGNREGVLHDIAAAACDLLGCPEAADLYVENEVAYEAAACAPNPLVGELAAALPDARLAFVSDMYLPGDLIARLLQLPARLRKRATIVSSADGLGSKRGGGVFVNIEARLGVQGAGFLHLGDSAVSDYEAPLRHGWRALHLPLPAAELRARRASYDKVDQLLAAHGIALGRYLDFNA